MERNPLSPSDDNDGSKPSKKGIDSYFAPSAPPERKISRLPLEVTRPQERRLTLPQEGILLFDREADFRKQELAKETAQPPADEKEKHTEQDETDDSGGKKAPLPTSKPFRPVIPGLEKGYLPPAAPAGERVEPKAKFEEVQEPVQTADSVTESATGATVRAVEHAEATAGNVIDLHAAEGAQQDAFGDLPQIEDHHVPASTLAASQPNLVEMPAIPRPRTETDDTMPAPLPPVFAGASPAGRGFERPVLVSTAEAQNVLEEDDRPAPESEPFPAVSGGATQAGQPNYAPPTTGAQEQTANLWPHYAYYGGNAPPGATGQHANQPPVPPGPPAAPGFGGGNMAGGPPPLNPNVYPASSAGSGPNYNAAPAALGAVAPNLAPNLSPNQVIRTRNADWTGRLLTLGTWLGSRRRDKKLGKRIDKLQGETNQNFDNMQTRQTSYEAQQRRQGREAQQMQTQASQENFTPSPYVNANQVLKSPPREAAPRYAAAPNTVPGAKNGGPETALAPESATEQPFDIGRAEQEQEIRRMRSTWLENEVNRRGEVVTDTRQLGEGFHLERQQEIIRDRTGDTMAAGALGVIGAQQTNPNGTYGQGAQAQYGGLPSGMTAPTLSAGASNSVDPQHRLPSEPQKTSSMPGPAFWIMLAIIVGAFFAAALI